MYELVIAERAQAVRTEYRRVNGRVRCAGRDVRAALARLGEGSRSW